MVFEPAIMKKRYGVFLLSAVLVSLTMRPAWAPAGWLSELAFKSAKPPQKKLDPLTNELLRKYEEYVNFSMSEEGIPGAAVAIVKDGEVIFEKGFGVRNIDAKDSVDSHTVFRLASLSKGFAPVIMGMLKEEGKLNWEDKVIDYIPDFELRSASQTKAINIKHLLSHTVGLPPHSFDYSLDHGDTYERLVKRLKEVRLSYKPGEMHTYQNITYSIVGDIAHKVKGKTYAQLLQERIFAPLDMKDASTGYEAIMATKNVALPHKAGEKKYYFRTPISDFYYSAIPAAGINASAADMGQWLLLLLGHRPDLISSQTLDEIFTPQVDLLKGACNCWFWEPDQSFYAMGWRVLDKEGQRILFHGGYVNSYRGEIAFSREDDIGIVVLSNTTSRFIGESTGTFFQMYRELMKTETPKQVQ